MELNQQQEQMCEQTKWDFSDLKALFLNCTLKKSPRALAYSGPDRDLEGDHGEKRRSSGGASASRLQPGYRRVARHDRTRLGSGRLARNLQEGRRRPTY